MAIQSSVDHVSAIAELLKLGADYEAVECQNDRDAAIRAAERAVCETIAFQAGCLQPDCYLHEACRVANAIRARTHLRDESLSPAEDDIVLAEIAAAVLCRYHPRLSGLQAYVEGKAIANALCEAIRARAQPVPAPEHGEGGVE